ncbi:MAG: hypothetical protein V2A76_12215 [Planctomycetota bacterium]
MGNPRLIITSPLLRARTEATVSSLDNGLFDVVDRKVELLAEPMNVARAAGDAGADVIFLGLAEPGMAEAARAELERHGFASEFIEVASASCQEIEYRDREGDLKLHVIDRCLPSAPDVDLLIDRLGKLLERGAAFVVTASDLDGAPTQDFVERVIGRACGLGVRTITAVTGDSLVQAFHAHPMAAFCEEKLLLRLAPPKPGTTEAAAETLKRVFEDPVRVMLVLQESGSLLAATREATEELGPLGSIKPGELIGALAAQLIAMGDDFQGAARAAYAGLLGAGSRDPARGASLPRGQAGEEAGGAS